MDAFPLNTSSGTHFSHHTFPLNEMIISLWLLLSSVLLPFFGQQVLGHSIFITKPKSNLNLTLLVGCGRALDLRLPNTRCFILSRSMRPGLVTEWSVLLLFLGCERHTAWCSSLVWAGVCNSSLPGRWWRKYILLPEWVSLDLRSMLFDHLLPGSLEESQQG